MAATATATAAACFLYGVLPFQKAKPFPSAKSSTFTYSPAIFSIPRSFFLQSACCLLPTKKKPGLCHCSTAQDVALEAEQEPSAEDSAEKRRKLYVVNLPWNFSAPDIEKLFNQCGTVKDVEIIKHKSGKSRGFAFVTMASGEEARAVIEKFDSYELTERIIRVEFAKSLRKPAPPPPPGTVAIEQRHKIYVSNLAWKVRSVNLKEFFGKFNPLSARVVFENPTGRSAGYGFVGFVTKEEAEAAISELDGQELLGRPVRLRISKRPDGKSESKPDKVEKAVEPMDAAP